MYSRKAEELRSIEAGVSSFSCHTVALITDRRYLTRAGACECGTGYQFLVSNFFSRNGKVYTLRVMCHLDSMYLCKEIGD